MMMMMMTVAVTDAVVVADALCQIYRS